ncbi:ROK family protein [Haladaptatus sp. DYSN1]|uniref:ROK family protein n=1 Tax=unclassified Haladaptatus TaxID=2622732 RepID=UPI002405F093|nr:ROK family protein [Haladaptatus sp. DYSN1]
MNTAPSIAVIDIGSTRIRYASATPDGPGNIHTEPTRPAHLLSQLTEIVERLAETTSIEAVSISTTGLVDAKRGIISEFDTPDGETLRDLPVAETIESQLNLPTKVENDCTAAAFGEDTFGAGHEYSTVVHVTFGTGIGAGVVVDGEPIRGERGFAAEVGLFPIVADGDLWSTDVRGAWEAYCSGRGIAQFATHELALDERDSLLRDSDSLTAPDVFDAAAEGDPLAQSCLDRIARYNAAGIGAIVNAFDPGIITLGGSVALKNPEWILGGIHEHIDDYVLADPPTIELTALGADIELYGATANYFDATKTQPVPKPRTD